LFSTQELDKYGRVMIWAMKKARKKPFATGEVVLIRTDKSAAPLADLIYKNLITMGINPVVRINLPHEMEKTFFANAHDHQLEFKTPGDTELYSSLNGLISLLGPESLTHLKDIDPFRIGKYAVAKKYLRDILESRENNGDFGWCLCLYPTPGLASKAGLEIAEYKEQVMKAVYLDNDDPVAEWQSIFEKSSQTKDWLNGLDVEYFRVLSENTDLKIYPGIKRRWLGVSGHNIPSFELFTSPDKRMTRGVFFADQPSYRSGNYVRGVRLEFRDGCVVGSSAEEGEQFLKKQLELDAGASYLGEFSLTDKRFSRIDRFMAHTLYDENFGGPNGNCHVALGASYADTYSGDSRKLDAELKNKLGFNDSALHWDLVNTEKKTVYAYLNNGGKVVVYDDGMFNLEGL
jgi:aminopeptidase